MKRLGIYLIGLGVVALLTRYHAIEGVWWEILFLLVGVFASLWVPAPKEVLKLGLHWRIAIIFGLFCTFSVVWMIFNAMLSEKSYAVSAAFFTFGCLSFLFHFLDQRKTST